MKLISLTSTESSTGSFLFCLLLSLCGFLFWLLALFGLGPAFFGGAGLVPRFRFLVSAFWVSFSSSIITRALGFFSCFFLLFFFFCAVASVVVVAEALRTNTQRNQLIQCNKTSTAGTYCSDSCSSFAKTSVEATVVIRASTLISALGSLRVIGKD